MTRDTVAPRVAPTLEAVAAAAGVSRSTVSRVVNGSSQVSPEVLAAVTQAIERLNYVPNRAARSLANRQTLAIALVVPEDTQRFFGDPFFSEVMLGITGVLEDSDYVLNLQLAKPSAPSEKAKRYLLGNNVDGAIVVSHHSGDEFFTTLDATIPVVFGGRPFQPAQHPSSYVDVDNAAGAAQATQHLIGLGRRKIASISGPADMQAALDRQQGWRAALTAAGLDASLSASGDFTMAGGALAMRDLLERHFPEARIAMELGSIAAVKGNVAAGVGVALVPVSAVRHTITDGRLAERTDDRTPLHRRLVLVHRSVDRLTSAASALRLLLLAG